MSGNITVAVSKTNELREACESYNTSLSLENIRFLKANTQLTVMERMVGFCIP